MYYHPTGGSFLSAPFIYFTFFCWLYWNFLLACPFAWALGWSSAAASPVPIRHNRLSLTCAMYYQWVCVYVSIASYKCAENIFLPYQSFCLFASFPGQRIRALIFKRLSSNRYFYPASSLFPLVFFLLVATNLPSHQYINVNCHEWQFVMCVLAAHTHTNHYIFHRNRRARRSTFHPSRTAYLCIYI